MPKGVPKKGFRMTKNRRKQDVVQPTLALIKSTETVEQIEQKLKDRFDALELLTEATGKGINRSLIVSGPPGLGKSYTIGQKMQELEDAGHVVTNISGYVRALSLYRLLYEARHKHCVVVFDDSDFIFADEVSLNLLKRACDSTIARKIHWLSKSIDKVEDEDGELVPNSFEFEGSVIFITNIDFDDLIMRGSKMSAHLDALVSRSHYLDLAMKTKMDYVVRIKQVVAMGMLRGKGLSIGDETTIVDFVEKNMENLRELSLRMVLKLATLMKVDPKDWQKWAKQTCFRNC